MTRAEEAALKAYPEETRFIRDYSQLAKRQIYQEGYEQAEKDLALTWDDMHLLDHLMTAVEFENSKAETIGRNIPFDSDAAFYGEVLRRFNEQRLDG